MAEGWPLHQPPRELLVPLAAASFDQVQRVPSVRGTEPLHISTRSSSTLPEWPCTGCQYRGFSKSLSSGSTAKHLHRSMLGDPAAMFASVSYRADRTLMSSARAQASAHFSRVSTSS